MEIIIRVERKNIVYGIDLKESGARHLPFPDETFDVLYNSFMLDLIPIADFPVVLKEFQRVLKKDGRLFLVNLSKNVEREVPKTIHVSEIVTALK